jgi:hypothetical protein
MPILIEIPSYYANVLPPDQKIQIHSLITNFNVVETVLCKISLDFLNRLSVIRLASYLELVLTLSKVCCRLSTQDVWLTQFFHT